MAQTNVNIRMDETLKRLFDHFCNELGITMSTLLTSLHGQWFASRKFLLKSPLMSPTLRP